MALLSHTRRDRSGPAASRWGDAGALQCCSALLTALRRRAVRLVAVPRWLAFGWLALLAIAPVELLAATQRLKDLATISGVRNNQLIGYGLVVGLDGTGDQSSQVPFTRQSLASMLQALGVSVPPGQSMQIRNAAAVVVTAVLPPFSRPGQAIDVTVSSIGNAKSLRGGTLLMTTLRGVDGQVYGVAQGNVLIAGAGASTPGTSVAVNQLASGRIPAGALIERAVPGQLEQDALQLELKESNFTLMQRAVEAIERRFGARIALPVDARFLQVRMPPDPNARMAFLAELEQIAVTVDPPSPRVVINSRTGTVVMSQLVRIGPCAVSHGALSVRVTRGAQVSQPAPFSDGTTVVTPDDDVQLSEGSSPLVALPEGASLDQVVRAINRLGTSVTDLIAILQAMKAVGALHADIEVI
jgi:flagellar P-ring protein FlgI